MQRKEKDTMSTILSLQEKCKDSTKLLQLRDKEASLNNIYALRRGLLSVSFQYESIFVFVRFDVNSNVRSLGCARTLRSLKGSDTD